MKQLNSQQTKSDPAVAADDALRDSNGYEEFILPVEVASQGADLELRVIWEFIQQLMPEEGGLDDQELSGIMHRLPSVVDEAPKRQRRSKSKARDSEIPVRVRMEPELEEMAGHLDKAGRLALPGVKGPEGQHKL